MHKYLSNIFDESSSVVVDLHFFCDPRLSDLNGGFGVCARPISPQKAKLARFCVLLRALHVGEH